MVRPPSAQWPIGNAVARGARRLSFFHFSVGKNRLVVAAVHANLGKALAISCLLSCAGIILVGETVLLVPFEASTSVFFITGLFCEKAVRAARRPRYPTARWNVSRGIPVRT